MKEKEIKEEGEQRMKRIVSAENQAVDLSLTNNHKAVGTLPTIGNLDH